MAKFIKILARIFILSCVSTAYGSYDTDDSLPSIELHFENLPLKKQFNESQNYYLNKSPNQKHKFHNKYKDLGPHSNNKNKHEDSKKEASATTSQKNEPKPSLEKPSAPENKPVQDIKPIITKPDVTNLPPVTIPVENNPQVSKEKEVSTYAGQKNEPKPSLEKPSAPENKPVQDAKPVIAKPDVTNLPPVTIPVENNPQVSKEKEVSTYANQMNEPKPSLEKPSAPENKPVQDTKPVIAKPDVNNLLPVTTPVANNSKKAKEENIQLNLPPLPLVDQKNNKPLIGTEPSVAPLAQIKETIKDTAQDTISEATQGLSTNLVASVIFPSNNNDIKAVDKSILDNAVKNLLSNNKKIKITAYNSNAVPDTLQIISLQRLISIKKYLSSNNIEDSRINTSIDSKNQSNIDSNRIDILYLD